ncbi:MAG: hypothetical protein IT372_34615 [Polyangiaceae bacterium]|nr:hypothetical protein [Polyangiaceae bacterium]
MYIARWHLTSRVGHTDACIALLRKWEVDVGQRVGWKTGSIRVLAGVLGAAEGEIEFEVRIDALSDLEGAWADMAAVPYHSQYIKELETLTVSGSHRWTIHRVVEVTPEL